MRLVQNMIHAAFQLPCIHTQINNKGYLSKVLSLSVFIIIVHLSQVHRKNVLHGKSLDWSNSHT